MKIGFRKEDHKYSIDGVPVDSVTQILQSTGIIDFSKVPKENLEASMIFGTYVHEATELYDKNNLNLETLHPKLRPYLDAWIKFKVQVGFEIELNEEKIGSQKYMFAGTLDRRGIINNQRGIVDIKTSVDISRATAIQTAGYMIAHNEMFKKEKTKFRMAVLLKPDGTYKISEYSDKSDMNVFLSSLTLHNWRKRR